MAPSSGQFIGFFDSGAGGLSVLAEASRLLPAEDFIYFGDSAYTPYGEKPGEWVVERSRLITRSLLDKGAKAIVIACNTATAVAAQELREEFPDVPIIGVEPALKPATEAFGVKRILVMATPITLRLDKYHRLEEQWGANHQVISVECPGLAARIEQGDLQALDIIRLLEDLIGPYKGKVDCVVLGCTHYRFIADAIRKVVGDLPLFDGAEGTARQLECRLRDAGLLEKEPRAGSVSFFTSGEDSAMLDRYRDFYQEALSVSLQGRKEEQ